jgi:hypothetical protein
LTPPAATAVGVSVLQQARAAGVRVVGTASPSSFEFVWGFGGISVEYGPGLLDRVRSAAPGGVAPALDTLVARATHLVAQAGN